MMEKSQKLPPDQRMEKMGMLLQPLLADRFKLAVTPTTKDLIILSLFRFEIGSHLQSAPLDCELPTTAPLAKG
jgi:uncharacterized protein (TIGR03435 family)